jgi:enamine deaminase RidA (YjgF/YER057c/UK114 family)
LKGKIRRKEKLVRTWLHLIVGLAVWTVSGWSQYKVDRKFLYPEAFKAGKPYSPGVLAGKTLYISGQVDKDPQTGAQPKGIAEQTRMAMANMGHVLRAAGMDYGNVVSCHVQLADMGRYKEMNETGFRHDRLDFSQKKPEGQGKSEVEPSLHLASPCRRLGWLSWRWLTEDFAERRGAATDFKASGP